MKLSSYILQQKTDQNKRIQNLKTCYLIYTLARSSFDFLIFFAPFFLPPVLKKYIINFIQYDKNNVRLLIEYIKLQTRDTVQAKFPSVFQITFKVWGSWKIFKGSLDIGLPKSFLLNNSVCQIREPSFSSLTRERSRSYLEHCPFQCFQKEMAGSFWYCSHCVTQLSHTLIFRLSFSQAFLESIWCATWNVRRFCEPRSPWQLKNMRDRKRGADRKNRGIWEVEKQDQGSPD